jgi:hypothetical protein
MPTTTEKISAIKENGLDIDFSRIFENAFENYKKIALISGIAVLLFSIIVFGIIIGVMGIFWGFSSITDNFSHLDPKSFSSVTILIYILVIGVFSGLSSPFTAGLFKIAHCADTDTDFSLGTVFEYYFSPYFKELFIASTLIAIVGTGINSLLESFGIRFLGIIITYVIAIFTFLVIPLIIFGNLKAIEAIKGSCTIVAKQFFVILGLIIVSYIMALLGLIGFCIGIFFTLPFIYSMYYSIYKDSIGFDE